jgi:plastocyanin
MTRTLTLRTIVALALTLALAAAGALWLARGPEPAGAASSGKTLRLSADKSRLKFNKTRLTVRHGKVTIVMSNPSGLPHAIAVEGHGIDQDGRTVTQGGTSRVTVRLKKGTYSFYCPVDGHKAAGMMGRLVVR